MENVLVGRAPMRLRRPARLLRLASDDRLVALVRAGEEGAFEAIYDRHHPAILGFCRHMLGTREEAEDAVQHTFLAAFRDLANSDKPIELRPWLFAIARNRCVSLLRARRPHVAIELAEPTTDGLAVTVERREDLRELLADLAGLPEDQRAALLLAELGALDHAGIAAVLGCPKEKVKALVFQARTSLAASREARATPCDTIRLELATASGAALRRGPLRRHLRTCDGCRAFRAEVATQRKLLALALPVVPSIALRASVLSGGASTASASSGGAIAASSGAVTGASGVSLGGAIGAVASTGAGKVVVSLAVAGVVASGSALSERVAHRPAAPSSPASPAGPAASQIEPSSPFERTVSASPGAASPNVPGAADRTARAGPGGSPAASTRTPVSPIAPIEPPPTHLHDDLSGGGRAPGTRRVPPSHTTPEAPPQPHPPAGDGRGSDGTPPMPAIPPPAQGKPPGDTPPATGAPSPPANPGPPASPPAAPPSGGRSAAPEAAPARPSPASALSGSAASPAPPRGRPSSTQPPASRPAAPGPTTGKPSPAPSPTTGKPSPAPSPPTGNASPPAPAAPAHSASPGASRGHGR